MAAIRLISFPFSSICNRYRLHTQAYNNANVVATALLKNMETSYKPRNDEHGSDDEGDGHADKHHSPPARIVSITIQEHDT